MENPHQPEQRPCVGYWTDLIQRNWALKELKNKWVFEDIDFGDDQIEQRYQDHRLKAIRTNWRFILLLFKIKCFTIAACFQFREGIPLLERIGPAIMLVLVFVLEYFIKRNTMIARYGAILYIICLGVLMIKVNLEFVQPKLYEGFLFHLSVSFLLSTCLISDWRVSSVAIMAVYASLYVVLTNHYESVPVSLTFALASSLVVFGFNGFLISKNFKQEFLSAFIAKQASSQLKKILEVLPEGVTIMDEQGNDLKFINKKLKQTFDVTLFHKVNKENLEVAKIKDFMDKSFDEIYRRVAKDTSNSEDGKLLTNNILNNFVIKVQRQKVEEGKGDDPDVQVEEQEEVSLPHFLQQERELCRTDQDNQRCTKVSILYDESHLQRNIEYLKRDFVVKTSKIDVVNDLETCPTFLQMFIDTTQITQLEEAKAQSNYQRQMLSNVSHEFRTPLNAMSLSLYLMKDHLTEDWAKYHKIASSSCDILKGLVEDILDFSKIEAGVFEVQESTFTFQQLFDEVNSIFEMQTRMKRIDLSFKMEDVFDELEIKSDKGRLKQILLNLLSNALKFTDRGYIEVELKMQEARKTTQDEIKDCDITELFSSGLIEEMPVCNLLLVTDNYTSVPNPSKFNTEYDADENQNVEMLQDQNHEEDFIPSEFTKELKVELSVTDTGIGIPERDLPSLFKVFGKTRSNHNRNQTGTGLGLTICKKLCEKLGGNIMLNSKEAVGTKVTCYFTCLY
ncbi:unnamed protein product [Moneuplotes crassus]|uniref:Histidine kinase domain-containing protein n=1 Tax=Euplotes crassus TaxID=5936 RepID=A0AAD1Y7N8_EUPCR|nr:unnamed protein product [Moneuplotes crassus]